MFLKRIFKPLKFTGKLILLLPFVIIFHIVILLFILFIIPFAIYRKILFYLAPIIKPDLGKMLNLLASGIIIHPEPIIGEIVAISEIEGQIDIDEFRSGFESQILDMKLPNGQLFYPELKQLPVTWMGYPFWKNCQNFSIADHISFWPHCQISNDLEENEIDQKIKFIRKEILACSFLQNKPMWNFYFVYDPKRNITHYFLKFHHSIADGFGALKLIGKFFPNKNFNDKKFQDFQKLEKEESKIIQFFQFLIKILYTPFHLTELLYTIATNKCDWQRNTRPDDFHPKFWQVPVGQSNLIKFDKLKEIACKHEVPVSSIILAGICGGVRNYMIKNQSKFSKYPSFATPIARPDHPDKLRNSVYVIVLTLPFNEENSIKRLKIIHNQIQVFKNRTFTAQYSLFIFILGLFLPHKILSWVTKMYSQKHIPPPSIFSYSGIPRQNSWSNLVYKGCQKVQISGFTAPGHVAGLSLTLSSYAVDDGIKLTGTGIQSVFKSDGDIQLLFEMIEDEIDILGNYKSIEMP